MNIIYITIAMLAFLWAFWGLYVLVMGIYRAHLNQKLHGAVFALSLPFLAIGILMDIAVNLTLASIAFAELPRELLVTNRLKRHIATSTDWRLWAAKYICDHLLDVFDPKGDHC